MRVYFTYWNSIRSSRINAMLYLKTIAVILSVVVLSTFIINVSCGKAKRRCEAEVSTTAVPVDVTTDSESEEKKAMDQNYDELWYTYMSGSYYKIHVTSASWDDAQQICSSEGGYLAVINNADEVQVVTKFATDTYRSWLWLYIGMRREENGNWRSVLGDPLDQIYHTWSYRRSYYQCGTIDWEGFIDSMDCSWKQPYICEKQC